MGVPELVGRPYRDFTVIDRILRNEFTTGGQCTLGAGLHRSIGNSCPCLNAHRWHILLHRNENYRKAAWAVTFAAKAFEITCTF